MVLTVLLGFIPGTAACLTIKKYEPLDASIGILSAKTGICIVSAGLLGTVFALAYAGGSLLCIFSALANIWMLLVTSYMDRRCGSFTGAVLAAGLAVQAAVTFVGLLNGTSPLYTDGTVRDMLLFLAVLGVLRLAGLAAGDCLIYLCCGLSFLALCGDYFPLALWVTLFLSSVTGLLFRTCRWIRERLSGDHQFWRKRFPFTAYIAAGCFFSYFLYAFFAPALLAGLRG